MTVTTKHSNPSRVVCLAVAVLAVAFFSAQRPVGGAPEGLAGGHASSQPATAPWPPTLPGGPEPMPIVQAAGVEEALDFTDDEKTILADVTDRDGQLSTPALYVLLRRSEMLPEGRVTLEEAEQPNPKDFWRKPERYRSRLVRVNCRYAGRAQEWTKQTTTTRWWGRRRVWMVDVLVEVGSTKPPTYWRMIVATGREPPKNPSQFQPRQLAGIFYKLVTLHEDADAAKGDPNITNEYPVIVAKGFYDAPLGDDGGGVSVGMIVVFAVVVGLLVVFMRLRRYVSGQRAAGRTTGPPRSPDAESVPAGPEPQDEQDMVDEELRRQVESYQAQRRTDEPDEGPAK